MSAFEEFSTLLDQVFKKERYEDEHKAKIFVNLKR
jgi:hypothetical protein